MAGCSFPYFFVPSDLALLNYGGMRNQLWVFMPDFNSLYMYDQNYPHSYYGSHTNKIAYSDLVYRSRFLNTNTLFTSTVCQFFAIQGFISLCWKMTFLGNWKKFTDNLMKLGKFYYLAYIKNTGLIHILNTSYVSPFPHFGNNYKGFSVNALSFHTMI